MIYFPGFEVKDENWLKFALLYLDKIRPIAPIFPSGNNINMSNSLIKIMNKTDLIDTYRPQYNEGLIASALACEEFEKFLKSPGMYSVFLGRPKEYTSIVDKWKNPSKQNYILFHDKYSDEFHRFCIEHSIATPCDGGIKIYEDLAFVYMSFLADIISKNNEFEMITDIQKYSSLLQINDKALVQASDRNLSIARNNIDFIIPRDLKYIPLDIFISLRSQNKFNMHRKAYMNEVKKLIEAKETLKPDYSLEEQLLYKNDFIEICGKSLNMRATVTITAVNILAIKGGVRGVAPLSFATEYKNYRSLNEILRNTPSIINDLQNKHHARKYTASIRKITKILIKG